MTQLKLAYLFILLGCLSMFSCKTDDELYIPLPESAFESMYEDMVFINGGDSLTWKITEMQHISELASIFQQSCTVDDLFTFYEGQNSANITFGNLDCTVDDKVQTYLSLSIYYIDNFMDSCCMNGLSAYIDLEYEYLSGGSESILFVGLHFLEINADRLIIVMREGENVIKEDYRDYKTYFVLERVR